MVEIVEMTAHEIVVKLLPDEYGNYRPNSENWDSCCKVFVDGEELIGAASFYAGMSKDDVFYCFNVVVVTDEVDHDGFAIQEYREYTCDRVYIERWSQNAD